MRASWAAVLVVGGLVGCGDGGPPTDAAVPTTSPGVLPVPDEVPAAPGAPDCRAVDGPAGGADAFDVRTLVGRPLREAQARAAVRGCTVRVVERDGEGLVRTDDLRPERANVVVRDGRIVAIDGVG